MEKTILITGCSSGIGKASCYFLKDKGYRVFATTRKEEDAAELKEHGIDVFLMDLNKSEQIYQVVRAVLQKTGGKLYAVCNNAGYAQPGALEDITRSNLKDQFETNVFGLHELTNQLLPVFRKQGYGRIINISSILGLIPLPFRGAYCASKYAAEGLADTLRLELWNTNIFVSLIEPGPIKTRFRDNALLAYQSVIDSENSVHKIAYQHFLANFMKTKDNAPFSKEPLAVAKKIYQALEDRKPKAHYFVTFPAYLFATLKRLLPTRWLDFILRVR